MAVFPIFKTLGLICVLKNVLNYKKNVTISSLKKLKKFLLIICLVLNQISKIRWITFKINASKCFKMKKLVRKANLTSKNLRTR